MSVRAVIAGLSLSAAGLIGLVSYEGYKDVAYLDTVGVPTLGFGTTKGVKLGDTISPVVALKRVERDVIAFEGELKACVKVPLYQHEYDTYVIFAYNIGTNAFCRSTLVRKLNALDYDGACKEILRWVKQPELKSRRAKEYAVCIGQ